MKIALPTKEGVIDNHFGHCDFYTILTVNEAKEIVKTEIMPSPKGCGCKTNIAGKLSENGVSVMLAGSMGEGALNKLSESNIEVVRGCSGPVMEVAEAYLKGSLQDSGEGCHHHHDGEHECQHGENEEHECKHHHND